MTIAYENRNRPTLDVIVSSGSGETTVNLVGTCVMLCVRKEGGAGKYDLEVLDDLGNRLFFKANVVAGVTNSLVGPFPMVGTCRVRIFNAATDGTYQAAIYGGFHGQL